MGLLDQILAGVDNTKRVAKKNISDLMDNPVDFLNMVTGRVNETSEKIRKGDVNETLNLLDPTHGVGTGLAGMIRKGGRTDLNLVHNLGSSLDDFMNLILRRGSISNPSVAIAKDNVFPFARTGTLVMNPASHVYDPGISPMNQLFNRDAYVSRAKVPVSKYDRPVEEVKNINPVDRDVGSTKQLRAGLDARFTEGGGPTEGSQMLAIMGSPRFKSFADYERSYAGAKNLTNKSVTEESEKTAKLYKDWLYDNVVSESDAAAGHGVETTSLRNQGNFNFLRKKANEGDEEAKHLMKMVAANPSNYAELKVVGEVGITPKNISALMIPESMPDSQALRNTLSDFTARTKIRSGTPSQLAPPELFFAQQDLAEATARYLTSKGKQGKITTPQALFDFDMPVATRPYIDAPHNLWGVTENAQRGDVSGTFDELWKAMTSSDRFAADVASTLTARDLDAVATPNILKALSEKIK